MSGNQETVADIIAEMRSGVMSATIECEACGEEQEQRFRFDGLAARIEAAWRRERELGNAAAMREALMEIRENAMADYVQDADYLIEKCNAALAAPPKPLRNCDVFADAPWDRILRAWHDWLLTPEFNKRKIGSIKEFCYWLLGPAEERKGDNDGK
jgi:hypothetical protein